jgi:HEAT repeat protein
MEQQPQQPQQPLEPYKGLRPYEEQNREFFFGREEERDIIIDKLLSNRMTLLFAASGVGKSSLLQAAVIPELKRPDRENLDVVYYSDWLPGPIEELKKETLRMLKERGKLSGEMALNLDVSLHDFFRVCSAFASDPLVIVLDQFEEFFQYHRYKDDFQQFIEEFSQCIKAKDTSIVFVISMREDYAMELNVFKQFLPTNLFANFFRLEKLEKKKAAEAVRFPVERLGFSYEEKLLDELLNDLAQREKEAQLGASSGLMGKGGPAYVEPPYLQIVCTGLWDREKTNPDKKIRWSVYRENKRARGFVDNYFKNVMNRFGKRQKKIASLAFNHLVTPRGTKIAYTVEALNNHIRTGENKLEEVLEKMKGSRILRTRKREDVVWYELYHDVFAGIIYQWNEAFKRRKRTKKLALLSGTSLVFLLAMVFYLFFLTPQYYLPPGQENGLVELYKYSGILEIKSFVAETVYRHDEFTTDRKLEARKKISTINDLNKKMIGRLRPGEKFSAYYQTGDIENALDVVQGSLENLSITPGGAAALLNRISPHRKYEALAKLLEPGEGRTGEVRIRAAATLLIMNNNKGEDALINVIKKNVEDIKQLTDEDSETQRNRTAKIKSIQHAVNVLADYDSGKAAELLIKLLFEEEKKLRESAVKALARIGGDKALDPLIEALKDDETKVRQEAAKALGATGQRQAVDPLIEALKDDEAKVRQEAAKALAVLNDKKAVSHLIDTLSDDEKNVRFHAAMALAKFDREKAVEFFSRTLNDKNKYVRQEAAEALKFIGSEKAVAPLIKALGDKDRYVRQNAQNALIRIGSEKTFKLLIRAKEDSDSGSYFRQYSGKILTSLVKKINIEFYIAALNDKNHIIRRYAVEAIGTIGGEKAIGPLIKALKDKLDKYVRQYAANAFRSNKSENARQPLIEALKDPEADIRRHVVRALENNGGEEAVAPLLQVLKDNDSYVRSYARAALDKLTGETSTQTLIDALNDKNSKVKEYAVRALGRIGVEKAVQPLMEMLNDEDKTLRLQAVQAIARIGGEKSTAALTGALKHEDIKVRTTAARGLLNTGNEEAVETLINALKDKDSKVRKSAANALGEFGNEKTVDRLILVLQHEDKSLKKYAIDILGNIADKKAVQPLCNILKSKEAGVLRERAAIALGKIGDETAVQPLCNALNSKDAGKLRVFAAAALGNFDSEKAVEALIAALQDKDNETLRKSAANALGYIGGETAVNHLIERLNTDTSAGVKAIAAEALGKIAGEEAVEPLLKALSDKGYNVKSSALKSLKYISSEKTAVHSIKALNDVSRRVRENAWNLLCHTGGDQTLEPLIREIGNKRASNKRNAIGALGRIRSEKAVSHLIKELKNSRYSQSAAVALGLIGSKKAVKPLIDLLNDKKILIRNAAAVALGRIGGEHALEHLFQSVEKEKAHRALFELNRQDSKKAEPFLIKIVEDKKSRQRGTALLSLARLNAQTHAPRFKTIFNEEGEHKNTDIKMAAAVSLLKVEDKDAREYIGRLLAQGDATLITAIAGMLGQVPGKHSISLLEQLLERFPVTKKPFLTTGGRRYDAQKVLGIRWNMIKGLVQNPSPAVFGLLKRIINDTGVSKQSRLTCIAALPRTGDVEAFLLLKKLLRDEDGLIRFRALIAIGKMDALRSPEIESDVEEVKDILTEKLEALEKDKKKWRRLRDTNTAGYDSDEKKDWQRDLDEVYPREGLEFELAYVISLIDKEEGLDLLSHPFANVRRGAWTALGNSRDVSLIPRLDELTYDNDGSWVRFAAYRAIDNILTDIEYYGDEDEKRQLSELLKNLKSEEGVNHAPDVKGRVRWTIDQIAKRLDKKPANR